MRKNPPGYPLPTGDLGEDEIVCQLVYLPNQPAYWQALFSALHYFTTWKAWERDDDHRGQDAASNWRAAFEMTVECWRMTCLDEITDRMDDIIAMLALKKDCCDTNITYGPGTEVETEIEPDVGDPPDFYGETAVTDWDDWREHVCHNAHVWVDSLVWQAAEMDDLLQLGGVTIGALGAALLLLGAVGLVIATPFAVVAATAAGILAAGTLAVFLTTAADIEAAREDIVCALIQGDSVSDVIENALGSASLDWLLFFSAVAYDNVTAIIYEGGYESEYLPPDLRDDCGACGFEQQSDSDVYVHGVYGVDWAYDEDEKEWSVKGEAVTGCVQVQFTLWETPSRITKKPCRVVVTSCGPEIGKCSSNSMELGYLASSLEWEHDHPPLSSFGLAAVDQYQHLHAALSDYTITFKLYV